MDPGVFCLSFLALTQQLLGYPDQALKTNYEALALAKIQLHPYSLATAQNFAAWLNQFRRDAKAAQEWAEATISLSTEQGFSSSLMLGRIRRGWALAEQGSGQEGIAQMREGLAGWHSLGVQLARPYFLALLAEAYGKMARADEGLKLLSEALTEMNKTGECWWKSEVCRLKGELILTSNVGHPESVIPTRQNRKLQKVMSIGATAQAEAEICFHDAIHIARSQQAKLLELRAATSLGRLWQSEGKREEAKEMLTSIYGWFTEGFQTGDLTQAKALLEQLA
jgi:predicted ATPase